MYYLSFLLLIFYLKSNKIFRLFTIFSKIGIEVQVLFYIKELKKLINYMDL